MITSTQNRSEKSERTGSAELVLGTAILGLLTAGAVGIVKAMTMNSGFDVALCLLGSVASFGTIYYIYFGRN